MISEFDKQMQMLVGKLPDEEEVTNVTEVPDMMPVVYEPVASDIPEDTFNNKDLSKDYQSARSNLYGLMGKTNAALDLVLKLAQTFENTKMLETAVLIINTSARISSDLINLQKSINKEAQNGKDKDKPAPVTTNVQNNYYGEKPPKDVTTKNIIDQLPDDDE